ncbi:aminoglycoside 6-adenylyltransferase [Mammaliicoccus sciuri]|uniref:aminoglycoside 6-adenylyltransferase n=1 Tax=Mammaliicoccus sciuri TaxID=1296 RepID=UPI0018B0D051|nr:aminoglycoside 6-adenylyltransferase [Mammaliicoccus sciuri]MBF9297548.1 aminoglycoside 6-adenylyltransferase [Staphylococcus schleiferi]MCJ0942251.1 aminoglycoside 6-adenylyltransferase [Mammaliicoccus sciuri]MDO0947783.1 aminoglycoside 6-adenylyltransferase [Mammaliicoccus sciuri]
MKTEREVLEEIFNIASIEDDIRAVYMNGSRVNKFIEPDEYQDFDIAIIVKNYESFIQHLSFIKNFGEPIISQCNRERSDSGIKDQLFYMVLFENHMRVDFRFIPIECIKAYRHEDYLLKVLIDKDHYFSDQSEPSDKKYHIKKPNQKRFDFVCNEFWWLSTYVVKGIKREEIFYAIDHLNMMRDLLLTMYDWKVGNKFEWQISTGKNHKLLKKYIPKSEWNKLLESYPHGEVVDITNSLLNITEQFYILSVEVAKDLNMGINTLEANKVINYIHNQITGFTDM